MGILAILLLTSLFGWSIARSADEKQFALLAKAGGAMSGFILIGAMIGVAETSDSLAYYAGLAAMMLAALAMAGGLAVLARLLMDGRKDRA